MATFQLRLRGLTPLQLGAATISAAPLAAIAYRVVGQHGAVPLPTLGLAAGVALLPWLSRAVARASYRAGCDEIAVHVRGEALPYRAITQATVEKTARRTTLHLERGETIRIELVLADAFAGRLEPWEELRKRLASHGHDVSR